jgi:hypothetical protein
MVFSWEVSSMSKRSDHKDTGRSTTLVSVLREELGMGGTSRYDMLILSGTSPERVDSGLEERTNRLTLVFVSQYLLFRRVGLLASL